MYSAVGDLLTGDIPLPAGLDPAKYVQDAADEVDSYLGTRYVTPVVVADNPTNRPTLLLLKRLNNFLASGRLILAAAAGGEDDRLHAYGSSLVKEALASLTKLASGEAVLPGATNIRPEQNPQQKAPLILNHDAVSPVDQFYDNNVTVSPYPLGTVVW